MANERFLNRWSRLKRDAAAPAAEAERAAVAAQAPVQAQQAELGADGDQAAAAHPASLSASSGQAPVQDGAQAQLLPSLDELNLDSDYSPFMRAEVDPARRMSALKKLFSDPHFNRMDGLDVYIDDYTKPDPIPKAMLARLNQSRLLGLFEEEKPAGDESAGKDAAGASDAGEVAAVESPAAIGPSAEETALEQTAVEDTAVEAARTGPAAQTTQTTQMAEPSVADDAAGPRAARGNASERDRRPDSRPDSPPEIRQAT